MLVHGILTVVVRLTPLLHSFPYRHLLQECPCVQLQWSFEVPLHHQLKILRQLLLQSLPGQRFQLQRLLPILGLVQFLLLTSLLVVTNTSTRGSLGKSLCVSLLQLVSLLDSFSELQGHGGSLRLELQLGNVDVVGQA